MLLKNEIKTRKRWEMSEFAWIIFFLLLLVSFQRKVIIIVFSLHPRKKKDPHKKERKLLIKLNQNIKYIDQNPYVRNKFFVYHLLF